MVVIPYVGVYCVQLVWPCNLSVEAWCTQTHLCLSLHRRGSRCYVVSPVRREYGVFWRSFLLQKLYCSVDEDEAV